MSKNQMRGRPNKAFSPSRSLSPRRASYPRISAPPLIPPLPCFHRSCGAPALAAFTLWPIAPRVIERAAVLRPGDWARPSGRGGKKKRRAPLAALMLLQIACRPKRPTRPKPPIGGSPTRVIGRCSRRRPRWSCPSRIRFRCRKSCRGRFHRLCPNVRADAWRPGCRISCRPLPCG